MATREQALAALLAVLSATADFKLVSRRNRSPESITTAESPALFLIEPGEGYVRQAPNLPPRRTLKIDAIFYADVGDDPNAIPLAIINTALDALDVAMKPDNPITGLFTLGGLVYSAMIVGDPHKESGAKTGRAIAAVPIEIILP